MREDMAKIIVERPRCGGYSSRKPRFEHWRQIDWDEHPRQIGKLRQWKDRKSLNENLAPLKRFLFSCVGRPWTDVHNELRERINMNSAVQLHIWQHVQHFVDEHVYKVGGKIVDVRGLEPWWLYVDPDTGRLCKASRVSRKKRPRLLRVKIDEYLYVLRVEGRWRKVVLKNLPLKGWEEKWDAYFKVPCGRVGQEVLTKTHGIGRYAVAVLPLTRDEEKEVERKLRKK